MPVFVIIIFLEKRESQCAKFFSGLYFFPIIIQFCFTIHALTTVNCEYTIEDLNKMLLIRIILSFITSVTSFLSHMLYSLGCYDKWHYDMLHFNSAEANEFVYGMFESDIENNNDEYLR